MDIQGNHYCSRCLRSIPEEMICPYCSHNPEECYDEYLIEEGTLLNQGRYRIGVRFGENDEFCVYGAWNYEEGKPVMIKELFPKKMVSRNVMISDYIQILPGKSTEYLNLLKQYMNVQRIDENGLEILDKFLDNGFGYRVYHRKDFIVSYQEESM